MTLKRKIIQIVEMDIKRCSLTYGSAPCAAVLGTTGVRKCFNTFKTCQDTANFASETETLRFGLNVNGLPTRDRIYPGLAQPVSTNPAKINLGGVSGRSTGLGKRARVTIVLQDFQDSDIWFDRYQAQRISGLAQVDEGGYNPRFRGEFLAKLRQRFPYYDGIPTRTLVGFEGEPLSSMAVKHYVVSEWAGPDAAGRVSIVAKDVLDLADNKKALAPAPSSGSIGADIDASSLAVFDLSPAGAGSGYSASGRASMGSEAVDYTRSGDTVTLTARGVAGTEAASHSTGDLFQQAYTVTGGNIADVANDLFVNYAGIDPATIPLAAWQAEASRWLAGFDLTTTIMSPTGINKLISELSQLGVVFWWDDVADLIQMRANRPVDLGETTPSFTDDNSFIEKTVGITDLYNERLTRVILWHGQIDASGSDKKGSNFKRAAVSPDLSAESDNEYGQTQVYEIFSRWLGDGNDSVANPVSLRTLNRYRDTPRQISFSCDAKDADDLSLARPVTVTSRVNQDATGRSDPTQMQITSIEEVIPGSTLKVTAKSHYLSGRYGYVTENSRPDYAASTAEEKAKGTYIVDGTTMVFSDGTGPYVMF